MDEYGYYRGWVDFKVIVTPSLQFGCDVRIKGPFSRALPRSVSYGLADYIQEQYDYAMNLLVEQDEQGRYTLASE